MSPDRACRLLRRGVAIRRLERGRKQPERVGIEAEQHLAAPLCDGSGESITKAHGLPTASVGSRGTKRAGY
jgi:hypothetical protein